MKIKVQFEEFLKEHKALGKFRRALRKEKNLSIGRYVKTSKLSSIPALLMNSFTWIQFEQKAGYWNKLYTKACEYRTSDEEE